MAAAAASQLASEIGRGGAAAALAEGGRESSYPVAEATPQACTFASL